MPTEKMDTDFGNQENNGSIATMDESQTDETESMIQRSLESQLGNECYGKFKVVLEFLGPNIYRPSFTHYNLNLVADLKRIGDYASSFSTDYTLEQHYRLKIKLYSFRFITNIGKYLLDKHEQFGQENVTKYFIILIKILVHHSLVARNNTANLALVELEQLCQMKKTSLTELYRQYTHKFLRLIIKAILERLTLTGNGGENGSNQTSSVISYMNRAFQLFNVNTIQIDDISQSLVITMILLHKGKYNEAIKLFIKNLANHQKLDPVSYLKQHIQAIVLGLILRKKDKSLSQFDMTLILKTVCEFCGTTPQEVLATKYTYIKGRILLEYSVDPNVVVDAMMFLSKFEKPEDDQPFEEHLQEKEGFIEYIQPSMIGILLGVDAHFQSSSSKLGSNESLNHIKSLTQIVSWLNEMQIQMMHHKLLSTLSLLIRLGCGLKNNALNEQLKELWKTYLKKLSNELKESILINIAVALHDLTVSSPNMAAELYQELTSINKTGVIAKNQCCLFFIPKTEDFSKIYTQLTHPTCRLTMVSSLEELQQCLDCALPLMKFENLRCHQIALSRLRELLKSNQQMIMSKMLDNLDHPLDKIISTTIESLLSLASTQDSECSVIVAECLGILGAVNPIRLDHLIYGEINTPGFDDSMDAVSLSDSGFIVRLVERLKNSLFSDRRTESEIANYVIQVIVKNFSRELSSHKPAMSKEAKRACDLCKNTSYMGVRRNPPDLSQSIFTKFKNDNIYSYKDWLDKFSLLLISLLTEPKIQEVLQACTYIFKHNPKFAEYILPIVAVHIILNQPKNSHIIRNEIMAIVAEDTGVQTQDIDAVYDQDVQTNLQTLHFQCANMVFCLLDAATRLELKSGQTVTIDREKLKSIKEFNQCIPKVKLALLASKCRAYARALYYFDQHFFAHRKWPVERIAARMQSSRSSVDSDIITDNQELIDGFDYGYNTKETEPYWVPLQRVFVNLHDQFEASGVDRVRVAPTSMFDELANFESSGDLEMATEFYHSLLDVMQDFTDKAPLMEDALRCLSNQSDHSSLYYITDSLMRDHPQMKQNILPSAIEACFKLNKWDKLGQLFKNNEHEPLLEHSAVSQGYLLSSLVRSREGTFDKLKIVRNKLMKPLSIAMMDQNAYFRGYQNLLVLHSIEDFELALGTLDTHQFDTQQVDENTVETLREQLTGKLNNLFNQWNDRIKLVNPSHVSVEPLLAFQRSICSALKKKYPFLEAHIDMNIGSMWLTSADRARDEKAFTRSFRFLSRARRHFGIGTEFHNIDLDIIVKHTIAHAKVNWATGKYTKAVNDLEQALNKLNNHGLRRHLLARRAKSELNKSRLMENYDPFPVLDPKTKSPACAKCHEFSESDRNSFAKLLILLTQLSGEAAASSTESILAMYEECVHLNVNQEEIFLCLARYYDNLTTYYMENPHVLTYAQAEKKADKQMEKNRQPSVDESPRSSQEVLDAQAEEVCTKLMEQAVIAFGSSMKYGVRYLEESMPRMMYIFYDLGSWKKPKGRSVSSRIEKAVNFIKSLVEPDSGIHLYYFLKAISLLLSRITHAHSGVTEATSLVLLHLFSAYPQQMMWRLIPVYNDTFEPRKKATNQLINQYLKRSTEKNAEEILRHIMRLSDYLVKLCVSHTKHDEKLNYRGQPTKLANGDCNISQIVSTPVPRFDTIKTLMPTQETMHAILPTENDCKNLEKYNVFPKNRLAYIKDIRRTVKVFSSLQQPRQVTFDLDNGKSVQILCKAGDDLRKDSRCIEFFNLLNRVLKKKSQSNARYMEVTTFLVLPLKPIAGLIEMVPNVETFRSVIERLYREKKGSRFNMHEGVIKRMRLDTPDAKLYENFINVIMPRVSPPVLQTFFQQKFPDPTAWYIARQAYVRSTAVMSMGGYIIGLGDRHLDNVLLDVKHGRVVHVDFNLLFHQGEILAVPECVPFRLTHNLVAPFGPTGIHGSFKKLCEITMQAMREEKDAILTILKPFIHDPCVDWISDRSNVKPAPARRDSTKTGGRRDSKRMDAPVSPRPILPPPEDNSVAKIRIQVVEKKLKGFSRSPKFKPMMVEMLSTCSVECQVKELILEAASLYNQSQMYFGWAPQV